MKTEIKKLEEKLKDLEPKKKKLQKLILPIQKKLKPLMDELEPLNKEIFSIESEISAIPQKGKICKVYLDKDHYTFGKCTGYIKNKKGIALLTLTPEDKEYDLRDCICREKKEVQISGKVIKYQREKDERTEKEIEMYG